MLPTELIDEAARSRLERAVRAAELGTAGEIVVVVARACDAYAGAPWRLGAALAALAFLGLALFAPPLPLWVYLVAQAAALGVAHAVVRSETVLRLLLSDASLERRVMARARQAFFENGLRYTSGRTGILIFVALLEHRVVVLGDQGIDRALDPDESWAEVVSLAVGGLRAGRPIDGLEDAIHRCGDILQRHLPPGTHPEADELPNRVVLVEAE